MENLERYYKGKVDVIAAGLVALKGKCKWFILAEIVTFLLAILFIYLYFTHTLGSNWWLVSVAAMLVYACVRNLDRKNDRLIADQSALLKVYETELKYVAGDFSLLDDGERFQDMKHEFSYDLDVFGKGSLYHRISRIVTSRGGKRLAQMLSSLNHFSFQRVDAINYLSTQEDFLAKFKAEGALCVVDSVSVEEAMKKVAGLKLPEFFSSPISFVIGWVDIIGFVGSIVLSYLGLISSALPTWWGVANFFVVFMGCMSTIKRMNDVVGKLKEQLQAYIHLINLIIALELPSDKENVAVVKHIQVMLDGAELSFAKLNGILHSLDSRNNIAGLLLFNIFGLNDLFLVRKFAKWQSMYVDKMDAWIEAVTEMDVLVSMATMKFNHPEAVEAEVVDADKLFYEARGVYHPFLGKNARKNDFTIVDHNYYIVTGANMAGKSTFLRALGVNYILAMNGLPVFADSFKVSRFRLFSSMRTNDDLTHGISYFNAELLRLKQLLKYVDNSSEEKENVPTLIILDEILKGTNSVDKLNGSRMFLEAISKKNVSGVIATHDLELSKMSDEQPSVFHNYCFEIKVGEQVTYDYLISPGVARNQNATYLLKQILEGNK